MKLILSPLLCLTVCAQGIPIGGRGAAGGSNGTPGGMSSVSIPSARNHITQWNHTNVFDFSSDSTVQDWKLFVSTANALNQSGSDAQNIILRKNAAPVQISDLSYSGVTGPYDDRFGLHAYTHFSPADNDRSTVDFSGAYFGLIGIWPDKGDQGPNSHDRVFEASGYVVNCVSGSTLIDNCGESFTVTPAQAGAQNLYVWTRTENVNATVTATGQSALALPTGVAEDEEVVTIPLNPANNSTTYTVTLTATSLQNGQNTGFLGITKVKLGGATAGNVPDNVVSSISPISGTPSHIYGAQILQADPPARIPAATTSTTLGLMDNLQTAVNNATGGTDIHLPVGFVWNGGLVLQNRAENGWVRIIADGAKNTFGVRANPADYPGGPGSPAVIKGTNDYGAVYCGQYNAASGGKAQTNDPSHLYYGACHHYAFVGLEIVGSGDTGLTLLYTLIHFNAGTIAATDGSSQAHDIIFQGCYIHRQSNLRNLVNLVNADLDSFSIYDSYLAGARSPDVPNQNNAVYASTTRGPHTFKNNYFEGASVDLIYGGGPAVPFLILQNVEITGNYFTKDLAFNTPNCAAAAAAPADYGGNCYLKPTDIKNLLEFKVGKFVTIKGNVFEYSIAGDFYNDGQGGNTVTIRNLDVSGSQPQDTSNFEISNNIFRKSANGIIVEGYDNTVLGQASSNGWGNYSLVPPVYINHNYDIHIANNWFDRLSFTLWGLQGRGNYQQSSCFNWGGTGIPINLVVENNTCTFDPADAAYNASGVDPLYPDVAYTGSLDMMTQAEIYVVANNEGFDTTTRGTFYTPPNLPLNTAAVNSSYTFQNNVLQSMVWQNADRFPFDMTLANNTFFAVPTSPINYTQYMTYLNNAVTNVHRGTPIPIPGMSGNVHTIAPNPPGLGARGVNVAALPNDCAVITGNRSDIACTPGQ